MNHQSQTSFVISELKANGKISRNYALSLYHLGVRPSITKLATLISDLRLKQGWNIEPRSELDEKGNKDMVYYVSTIPKSTMIRKSIIINNIAQEIYV